MVIVLYICRLLGGGGLMFHSYPVPLNDFVKKGYESMSFVTWIGYCFGDQDSGSLK